MALEHLVLGLIASHADHGYALWRRIDDRLGACGSVERAHVYRALAALERRRLVSARDERPPGRPRRRTFDVTADGRAALRARLAGSFARAPLFPPSPLLAKLAVRAALGEQPSERELRAERAVRVRRQRRDDVTHGLPGGEPDVLAGLLRRRARRHLEVELWLLEQLEAHRAADDAAAIRPRTPTRARSGSASR